MYFVGCALFVAAMAVACGGEQKKADDQNAQQTEKKADDQKAPEQTQNIENAAPVENNNNQTVGENLKEEGENTANAAIDAVGKKATEKVTGAIQNL